jgi:hypothetical protein
VESRIIPVVLCVALVGCTGGSPAPAAAKSEEKAPEVRITQFYASPANPPRGEKTLLCYGVENATEVRLDPPVEKVWPAMARCFDIDTTKGATYKLTAVRGAKSVSESVTIKAGPPAVKIIEVSINQLEFAPGEQVTVCYKVKNAVATTIQPGAWIDPHSPSLGCVVDHPQKTTTYTVTATGSGGDTDSERVTAKVK